MVALTAVKLEKLLKMFRRYQSKDYQYGVGLSPNSHPTSPCTAAIINYFKIKQQ
jgi:hypothetical protein